MSHINRDFRRVAATVTVAAASALALTGAAAHAQTTMADFNQTDHTAMQFTNSGSASTFSMSGAAFDFNYNGTTYHTLLNISSDVSGPAISDPVSGDNGTGTVSENLKDVTMQFVNTDSHSAVHNVLSYTGGTAVLYGLLDDPTNARSNISSAGFATLDGTWTSSLMSIPQGYASSVSIAGITPDSAVSLQSNGHLKTFTAGHNSVIGGFQSQPVPEAGTLLSLGGMVLSSGGLFARRALTSGLGRLIAVMAAS